MVSINKKMLGLLVSMVVIVSAGHVQAYRGRKTGNSVTVIVDGNPYVMHAEDITHSANQLKLRFKSARGMNANDAQRTKPFFSGSYELQSGTVFCLEQLDAVMQRLSELTEYPKSYKKAFNSLLKTIKSFPDQDMVFQADLNTIQTKY